MNKKLLIVLGMLTACEAQEPTVLDESTAGAAAQIQELSTPCSTAGENGCLAAVTQEYSGGLNNQPPPLGQPTYRSGEWISQVYPKKWRILQSKTSNNAKVAKWEITSITYAADVNGNDNPVKVSMRQHNWNGSVYVAQGKGMRCEVRPSKVCSNIIY